MDDYKRLRTMYEDLMAENAKLKSLSRKEIATQTDCMEEELQHLQNTEAEQNRLINNMESSHDADQEKMEKLKKENEELANKLKESVKIAEFYQTKVKAWEKSSSRSKECLARQRPVKALEGIGFDRSKAPSFHQQKSKFIKFADSQPRETMEDIFPDSRDISNMRMLVRAKAVIQPPRKTTARSDQHKAAQPRKADFKHQPQPRNMRAEPIKKAAQPRKADLKHQPQQRKAEARTPAWYHRQQQWFQHQRKAEARTAASANNHRQQRWFQHQRKAEAQSANSAKSHRRQRWTQTRKAEVRTATSAPQEKKREDRIVYIDFRGRQVTAPHNVKVVRLTWVPKVKTNPKGPNLEGVPKM